MKFLDWIKGLFGSVVSKIVGALVVVVVIPAIVVAINQLTAPDMAGEWKMEVEYTKIFGKHIQDIETGSIQAEGDLFIVNNGDADYRGLAAVYLTFKPTDIDEFETILKLVARFVDFKIEGEKNDEFSGTVNVWARTYSKSEDRPKAEEFFNKILGPAKKKSPNKYKVNWKMMSPTLCKGTFTGELKSGATQTEGKLTLRRSLN